MPPLQNDLQAMARCHRIGQLKEVTVYRLVSRDTYESQVFSIASRKYGLDEAILGTAPSSGDTVADGKKIANLLKCAPIRRCATGLASLGCRKLGI